MHTEFAQGDVVTTMIKCARGETIVLTLDNRTVCDCDEVALPLALVDRAAP